MKKDMIKLLQKQNGAVFYASQCMLQFLQGSYRNLTVVFQTFQDKITYFFQTFQAIL